MCSRPTRIFKKNKLLKYMTVHKLSTIQWGLTPGVQQATEWIKQRDADWRNTQIVILWTPPTLCLFREWILNNKTVPITYNGAGKVGWQYIIVRRGRAGQTTKHPCKKSPFIFLMPSMTPRRVQLWGCLINHMTGITFKRHHLLHTCTHTFYLLFL